MKKQKMGLDVLKVQSFVTENTESSNRKLLGADGSLTIFARSCWHCDTDGCTEYSCVNCTGVQTACYVCPTDSPCLSGDVPCEETP